VVERWFAQLSGIGWIGKNTCMLNQEKGSWLLLGVMLTSLPMAETATLLPAADRCGTCTRCIDACPTDALIAPRQMDASRCIAYLTIEKKGSIDESLRPHMGRQVFGCDICQDVCPWNRRAPVGTAPDMQARIGLVNPSLEDLASMDTPEFKRRFRGSPLERTGRRRLQRNVALAMGNSGDARHRDRLTTWATGEDEMLREAAQWALERMDVSNGEGTSQVTEEDGVRTKGLC
jgi:epoxyqueuosine reductase